ncbi:aconitase A [Arthrobacter sp. UYCu511]|uniref:aconitase family protein n=1 Tax=Arthrobacter sp. UYCu511 TaxID=3156337 RepID=UPI003396E63A
MDYLRLTEWPEQQIQLVVACVKEQGLWHDAGHGASHSQSVEFELAGVEPFIDSPKRPQDRIPLACDRDRPGDRPVDRGSDGDGGGDGATSQYPSNPAQVTLPGTTPVIVEHGRVVTTCIGSSGPLIPQAPQAVTANDLTVSSVLSGNRNFEGRIHPQTQMNVLASPPLVVAYALAGTMNIDLLTDSLGEGASGEPVYLRDIWPSSQKIQEVVGEAVHDKLFAPG